MPTGANEFWTYDSLEWYAHEHVKKGIDGLFYPEMDELQMLRFFLDVTLLGRKWNQLLSTVSKGYTTIEEALVIHDALEDFLNVSPDPEWDALAREVEKYQSTVSHWLLKQPRPIGFLCMIAETEIMIPSGAPWRNRSNAEEFEHHFNYFPHYQWVYESGRITLEPAAGMEAHWMDSAAAPTDTNWLFAYPKPHKLVAILSLPERSILSVHFERQNRIFYNVGLREE